MNNPIVKALIKEAITQRISEIDKAGNEAAENAKLAKIEQDAKKVATLKTMLGKEVFKKYIDAKILKAVIKDLDGSARELNKAKVKLEKEKEKRDRKAVKK
tara:strand:- start:5391 stop:5693 length:303 start_codon:yes stop_codon:yes gene_type:complete